MLRSLLGLLSLLALLLMPLPVAAQAVTHEPTATPPNERVTYIHTDALGSPILGTDALGNVVWREDYQPYGERFLGVTAPSQRLYTGKYAETRSGLVDFGGRWYNPEIGRFYSVDPQGFDETNPHSFNRYAYANNNPYRFTDPDGEAGLDIVKLGPAAGASFGALAAYGQGQVTGDAALVDASVAVMNAMMGSNAEALVSLVTPPGTARVVMNAATGTAADRAKQIHSVLDARTQRARTTAVTETQEGVHVVSSSERRLTPAQRAQLGANEVEGIGVGHAEVTGVNAARGMGLTPTGTAASRPICSSCASTLREQGVAPLSPLK